MVPVSLTRRQCGVRKVLIAIAVLIVLVWLIPWDLQPDGQIQVPPPVAPVIATPESRSTPAVDDAPVLSDEPAADDPAEPPVLLSDRVTLTPMEQKAQSARALIDPELTSIENAFAAEAVDPPWARGMEGNILGHIAQAEGLQLVTMQVECRTSMCRVQLMESPSKIPDMAAFRDLVRGFGLDVWRMQNLGNQSGATTTVAYLARPGDCYHGRDRSVCYSPR
jgi:hypothetical protein